MKILLLIQLELDRVEPSYGSRCRGLLFSLSVLAEALLNDNEIQMTAQRVPDLFITSLITDRIGRKIQTKQNHVIGLMFFATLSGKNTDSVLHLYLISWKS